MAIRNAKIKDLHFDNQNINKGSQYGQHLLGKSLQEVGAGRSILLDKNGIIIAGNQTTQKAAELGFEDVIIVQSDGKKLIAVQRTDIDINSAEGAKLKILDNTVSAKNYVEDAEVMEAVCEEYQLEAKEYGLSAVNVDDTDYSEKNKEIDLDEFEEKMEFKLKLTSDEFFDLQERLSVVKAKQNVDTNEQAIFELLNSYEARA